MLRRHLRTHLIAWLALFVALSGTSYAAVALKRGQVKAKHLAAGAVTTKKIRTDAVTGAKVRNGSLTAADLAPGVVPVIPAAPTSLLVAATVAGASSDAAPAANSFGPGSMSFTVAESGGTLVIQYGLARAYRTCTASAKGLLTLDGEVLPGSNVFLAESETESTPVLLSVQTPAVAGEHTLRFRAYCSDGQNAAGGVATAQSLTVVQYQDD